VIFPFWAMFLNPLSRMFSSYGIFLSFRALSFLRLCQLWPLATRQGRPGYQGTPTVPWTYVAVTSAARPEKRHSGKLTANRREMARGFEDISLSSSPKGSLGLDASERRILPVGGVDPPSLIAPASRVKSIVLIAAISHADSRLPPRRRAVGCTAGPAVPSADPADMDWLSSATTVRAERGSLHRKCRHHAGAWQVGRGAKRRNLD
jgi:hypothetical protein